MTIFGEQFDADIQSADYFPHRERQASRYIKHILKKLNQQRMRKNTLKNLDGQK